MGVSARFQRPTNTSGLPVLYIPAHRAVGLINYPFVFPSHRRFQFSRALLVRCLREKGRGAKWSMLENQFGVKNSMFNEDKIFLRVVYEIGG